MVFIQDLQQEFLLSMCAHFSKINGQYCKRGIDGIWYIREQSEPCQHTQMVLLYFSGTDQVTSVWGRPQTPVTNVWGRPQAPVTNVG